MSIAGELARFVTEDERRRLAGAGARARADGDRQHPTVARLIDKITVDPNPPPYPDRFPHHHGATVTIMLTDGRRFADHVDLPRGSAPRGIDWGDVDAKYRRLVPLVGLAPDKVEASLGTVHGFDTVEAVSELMRLLR